MVRRPTYGVKVENDKFIYKFDLQSLHNDVDIKIGIIYKNRKNVQKPLKLGSFWSIVLMQSDNKRGLRPLLRVP